MSSGWKKFKKGLSLLDVDKMSRAEWLVSRQDGLGGSDMGTIMGLNDRFSRLQLFYQKIGLDFTEKDLHNPATLIGQLLEDDVITLAEYFDFESNDPENWVRNFETGTKKREISTFRYMVRNDKYPWLLANIDGLVNARFSKNLSLIDAESVSEAKTISRQSADKWLNRFPPYYFAQGAMYVKVMEPVLRRKSFQVFLLQERILYGYDVEPDSYPAVVDRMMNDAFDFHLIVEKGKDIVLNSTDDEQMSRGLSEIEPPPDASPAYEKFLSELWKKKASYVKIMGSDELYEAAVRHEEAQDQIRELERVKQINRNFIKKIMKDHGADVIDFGRNGKITFNNKLYINIK